MSNMYLTCPYCGKSGYKNLPSHTRQVHGKDLKALLKDYPGIEYEHPEYVENKVKSIRESCRTDEFRQKMSEIVHQGYEDDPERRKKASDKIKNQVATGNIVKGSGYEALKRHREEDPEWAQQCYDHHSDTIKEWWSRDHNNIVDSIKNGWTDEKRTAQSDRTSRYMITHEANAAIPKDRKDQLYSKLVKIQFRSFWELQLAEALYIRNIPFNYESFRFLYHDSTTQIDRFYVIDFYLPQQDCYIEVKPTSALDNNAIDKVKAVINQGKNILICTENELSNINSFINKIVEGKLQELLETRKGYIATAQLAIADANA